MVLPTNSYDESHIVTNLTDMSDMDMPQNIKVFLSMCETALLSDRFHDYKKDSKEMKFIRGVMDYWWGSDLNEPTWEQMFRKNFETGQLRQTPSPSHKRFCYQQGAILGYRLKQRFRETDEKT